MRGKKNKILIIIGITLLFFECLMFYKNYNFVDEETRLLEEQIKKQNEIKELINIDELSDEFMDNYFQKVSEIKPEDEEKILIITSKKKIDNTYGAKDVIEAPNNQYYLIYQSEEDKDKAYNKLQKIDYIVSVEHNELLSDETIDEETDYYNTDGEEKAYNSWGVEFLGYDNAIEQIENIKEKHPERIKEVVVAIIDTGLDYDVFKSKYGESKLAAMVTCDANDKCSLNDDNSSISDIDGHGTHIAGTIAEATPSSVKILPIKTSSSITGTAAGIYYSVGLKNDINEPKNIGVINISRGSYNNNSYMASLYTAIETANKSGITVVVTAGNNNNASNYYPGSFDNVISVSAVDSHLLKTQFSNYSDYIGFAAPGYKITSLDILLEDGTYNMNENGICNMSGTSMAAPHVSAAVAILKSFNKDLTLEQTTSLLKRNAIDIGDDGKDEVYGNGVISFNGAVFCGNEVKECDEYGVFEKNDNNGLKTIRIESNGEYAPKYNYGSVSNIINAEIKLYYTNEDYYIRTLAQLINDIDIIGYEPNTDAIQIVTIKYKGLETKITIDNKNLISGWEYEESANGLILSKINYETQEKDKTYSITNYPQTIYVPSDINKKTVYSIEHNFFKDIVEKSDINVNRLYVPEEIKNIGKNVLSVSNDTYKVISKENAYYKLPFLEVVLPESIEYIDDSAFKMEKTSGTFTPRSNMIFYVVKDSYAHVYVTNNNIPYLYIDNIDISLDKTEYNALETIHLDDLSIQVNYKGDYLDKISSAMLDHYEVKEDYFKEEINSYAIRYNNESDSLKYGDDSFTIEFDTKSGYQFEEEIAITVNKIIPEYDIPIGLNGIIGQKLSDIELPSNFEWMDPEQVINEQGNITFKIKYIPEDNINYETIENIEVIVNVTNDKTVIEPQISITDKEYNGTTDIDLDTIGVFNLSKDEYTIENANLSDSNVGNKVATIKLKLTDEKFKTYKFSNELQEMTFEVNMKITPQQLVKPTLINKEYVYNKEEQTIELNNYDNSKMNIFGNKRTDAGEYEVTISLKNTNYIWNDNTKTDITLKFKINKAQLNVTDESKNNEVIYNGKEHGININLNTDKNITLKYMDKDGEYNLDEMPKYSEVGTYIIKYKLYLNDNYTEHYGEKTLKIMYNMIINNSSDYVGVYDGLKHSIKVDVKALDYKIKYSINNTDYNLDEIPKFKDIGEYTVYYKITAKGYKDLVGSNKVKIYGIKDIDPSLVIKNSILVSKDNNLNNVINKINVYSNEHIYTHYNNKNEVVTDGILKTGDSIKILLNNLIEYKYDIAILGDINGDGIINSADLLRVRQYLLGKTKLENSFYISSDINDDEIINSADLLRLRQHLLGVFVIK